MPSRKRSGNTPVEQQERSSSPKRADAALSDRERLVPRPGPDTEAYPGERRSESELTGSQTGTVGDGGPDAHKPPLRRHDDTTRD
jgi:hypothetical protein